MFTQLHPYDVQYLTDPSQEELRALTLEHTPAVYETRSGNLNKMSRNKARMAKHTYVISEPSDADSWSHQTMPRAEAEALIQGQRDYIRSRGRLIEIRGDLGLGPRAVGVQWLYTIEGANIAGMQQVLSFPTAQANGTGFQPSLRVVYTPDHRPDLPGGQAILVDLENFTTYVMGPDYFGESKKGALRMLNEMVYRQNGLVLHAGAKLVRFGDSEMTMTIMGLSGTGKTTTTFSKQGDVTQPIQDDMVVLWPEGELSVTENGCFAKTFGLTEESEPVIYRGTLSPEAWVENVYLNADGSFDFFKGAINPEDAARLRQSLVQTGADPDKVDRFVSGQVTLDQVTDDSGVLLDGWDFVKWTENGRSIIPMSSVEDAADLHHIPPVRSMGILNRDEGRDAATPGILKFVSPEQAAGYFMLGETTKTSAAGKEVGKTRSPFTQPFFPRAHGLQAERFSEIAATMPQVSMWMM
ncbi:MAG: phosphoenolpyruvate carboxykinase (ATP), partial [Myxococcota bacterium]|nr:phosphoenolpyruvate carboxykinase (ATP) [Myxococcota bacterium]